MTQRPRRDWVRGVFAPRRPRKSTRGVSEARWRAARRQGYRRDDEPDWIQGGLFGTAL